MNHVMLDLETMSSKSTAAIASIGAVKFDPNTGQLGDQFYTVVDLIPQEGRRHFSGSTIQWWLGQSDAARRAIIKPIDNPISAAMNLSKFFTGAKYLWAHATFDPVITASFYEEFGIKTPWHFSNVRDIRTIVGLARELGYKPPENTMIGTEHNALDDAIEQVKYVSAMYQYIKGHNGKACSCST